MGLSIQNVTKKFGEFTAVDNLHLEIEKGKMFGMLGANGAGKTTTFRMILGLLEPTDGIVSLEGKKITHADSGKIGYLPEERGLYPKLKVSEQLIYLGRLRGRSKAFIIKETERWLKRFRIEEYANKRVEELSKGNQQKIQFIASIIHKPELLILDEPFSGLDPINVELLKEAVLSLNEEGTTIVFSSHRMEHVEELCEQLCILHHGKPVVEGRLKEIKRSFGKKNLIVGADYSLEFLQQVAGVTKFKRTQEGAVIQVADEEVAKVIFQQLTERGFVRKFVLEEPSLNDIFIEKVGASYE